MNRILWLQLSHHYFFSRRSRSASRLRQQTTMQRRVRPFLEFLEDRSVPTVFTVGAGDVSTLIADINTANSNGQSNVINLTASTYNLTTVNNFWYGANGLPAISSNLTVHGNGATIQRASSGAPYFRLFYVSGGLELPPGSLMMDNVTLEGGVAKGGDSNHGGGGFGRGRSDLQSGHVEVDRRDAG